MGFGNNIKGALRGKSGNQENIPLQNLRSVSDGPTTPYPRNSAMRNKKGRSSARAPRGTNNKNAPNYGIEEDWWNDPDAYGKWIAKQPWFALDREWLAQDWVAQDWYHMRENPEHVRREWGAYIREYQKLKVMQWSSQVTGPPPPEDGWTYTDPPKADEVDAADKDAAGKTEEVFGGDMENTASPTISPQPCRRYAEVLKGSLAPSSPRPVRNTSMRPA